jgi:hypothetical protein
MLVKAAKLTVSVSLPLKNVEKISPDPSGFTRVT